MSQKTDLESAISQLQEAIESFGEEEEPQDGETLTMEHGQNVLGRVAAAREMSDAVEKEDGTGTGRYQRAQEQVDRFQQEHFDALREHTAVSQSRDQRKAAADKAKQDAADAKAKAQSTAAAAKVAHQKVKDQIKICGGQADAVTTAQDDLDKARSSAADADRQQGGEEGCRSGARSAERPDQEAKAEMQARDGICQGRDGQMGGSDRGWAKAQDARR